MRRNFRFHLFTQTGEKFSTLARFQHVSYGVRSVCVSAKDQWNLCDFRGKRFLIEFWWKFFFRNLLILIAGKFFIESSEKGNLVFENNNQNFIRKLLTSRDFSYYDPKIVSLELTCKIVGCVMWCPLTNVNPSACNGVTVQTPSWSEIRQCRAWIDGPNNDKAFVFAEPTSTGSVVSLNRRPPSPEWVISIKTGPSRSAVMFPPPLLIPSGFFFRRRGCESAGRRRTWNMMDPAKVKSKKLLFNYCNLIKRITKVQAETRILGSFAIIFDDTKWWPSENTAGIIQYWKLLKFNLTTFTE